MNVHRTAEAAQVVQTELHRREIEPGGGDLQQPPGFRNGLRRQEVICEPPTDDAVLDNPPLVGEPPQRTIYLRELGVIKALNSRPRQYREQDRDQADVS